MEKTHDNDCFFMFLCQDFGILFDLAALVVSFRLWKMGNQLVHEVGSLERVIFVYLGHQDQPWVKHFGVFGWFLVDQIVSFCNRPWFQKSFQGAELLKKQWNRVFLSIPFLRPVSLCRLTVDSVDRTWLTPQCLLAKIAGQRSFWYTHEN